MKNDDSLFDQHFAVEKSELEILDQYSQPPLQVIEAIEKHGKSLFSYNRPSLKDYNYLNNQGVSDHQRLKSIARAKDARCLLIQQMNYPHLVKPQTAGASFVGASLSRYGD